MQCREWVQPHPSMLGGEYHTTSGDKGKLQWREWNHQSGIVRHLHNNIEQHPQSHLCIDSFINHSADLQQRHSP
ncbi:hypothetical protein FGO68_gene230 [Halteria grandinella]|uniref:Uncharacterized protein n=1 Tax=Halteria grandinella TaxID=5974 RepID=A0A8J8NEW4_HALGN|nr:hypothetical protein FGO68_gene230 [Halteria grandinella]